MISLFKICPMVHVCPSKELINMLHKVPKNFMLEEVQDKPSCPFCLLAVTQIYNVIKDDKTEVIKLSRYISHIYNNTVYNYIIYLCIIFILGEY